MKTQAISQNQNGQSSNKLVFKKPRLFVKNDRCQTEISSDSDINQDKTTLGIISYFFLSLFFFFLFFFLFNFIIFATKLI